MPEEHFWTVGGVHLWTTWHDDRVHIAAFDGSSAYEGVLQQAMLQVYRGEGQSAQDHWAQSKQVLSGSFGERGIVEWSAEAGKGELVWKYQLEENGIRVVLGKMPLATLPPPDTARLRDLAFRTLITRLRAASQSAESLHESCTDAQRDRDRVISSVQSSLTAAETQRNRLVFRFAEILNAKKRKLRLLMQAVRTRAPFQVDGRIYTAAPADEQADSSSEQGPPGRIPVKIEADEVAASSSASPAKRRRRSPSPPSQPQPPPLLPVAAAASDGPQARVGVVPLLTVRSRHRRRPAEEEEEEEVVEVQGDERARRGRRAAQEPSPTTPRRMSRSQSNLSPNDLMKKF